MELIPFAIRVVDGQLVDVHDVPRGLAADCICLSCRTPLLARQGDHKSWHFAHATRGTFRSTETKCQFSLYASIRMMARQVIGQNLSIRVPACNGKHRREMVRTNQRVVEFSVSPAQTIKLEDVRVEVSAFGTNVDIVGAVSGYEFILYLEHPGRDLPEVLTPASLLGTRVGVVAVNLGAVPALFQQSSRGSIRYQELLVNFLEQDTESKRWVHHPRYVQARDLALRNAPATNEEHDLASDAEQVKFQCVICHVTWTAPSSLPSCPRCRSHLYSRRL